MVECIICGKRFVPLGLRKLCCSPACTQTHKHNLKVINNQTKGRIYSARYYTKLNSDPIIQADKQRRLTQREYTYNLNSLSMAIKKIKREITLRITSCICNRCHKLPKHKTDDYCVACSSIMRKNQRAKHPQQYKEYQRRFNLRVKSDPIRLLTTRIRGRMSKAIKRHGQGVSIKGCKLRYLGCTAHEAFRYITLMLKNNMSWDNYGEWHVDHIIPLCSFDLSKEEERRKAFHYTNLQPLWAIDNMRKNKYI